MYAGVEEVDVACTAIPLTSSPSKLVVPLQLKLMVIDVDEMDVVVAEVISPLKP